MQRSSRSSRCSASLRRCSSAPASCGVSFGRCASSRRPRGVARSATMRRSRPARARTRSATSPFRSARCRKPSAASLSKMTELAHRDALTGLPTRVLFADRLEQAIANGARAGYAVSGAGPRPRSLLARQRHARPPDRRPVAARGRGAAALGDPAGERHRRAPGWRRVRDHACPAAARAMRSVSPRRSARARSEDDARRAHRRRPRQHRHRHLSRITAPIRRSSVERADVAMHAAKQDQLGIAVWDERYDQHGEKRLSLMSDLRKAVDNDELALIYQPKIALGRARRALRRGARAAGSIRRAGSCRRRNSFRSPSRPATSATITQWVLGRAIAQCAEWRSRGLPMNVSINISARDLVDNELPERSRSCSRSEGCAGAVDVARDHRERDRRRARSRAEEPRAAARAGLQARGRRLRHRLFVARLPAAAAARRAQDRQVVHRWAWRRTRATR